jgi:hypothetical protein
VTDDVCFMRRILVRNNLYVVIVRCLSEICGDIINLIPTTDRCFNHMGPVSHCWNFLKKLCITPLIVCLK